MLGGSLSGHATHHWLTTVIYAISVLIRPIMIHSDSCTHFCVFLNEMFTVSLSLCVCVYVCVWCVYVCVMLCCCTFREVVLLQSWHYSTEALPYCYRKRPRSWSDNSRPLASVASRLHTCRCFRRCGRSPQRHCGRTPSRLSLLLFPRVMDAQKSRNDMPLNDMKDVSAFIYINFL